MSQFASSSIYIPGTQPSQQIGALTLARRRYQRGSLFLRGRREKVWVGRWLEDEILPNGTVHRKRRSEVIGTLKDIPTKRLAQRELESRIAVVNSPTYRAKPTAKFREFAERWERSVLSQHKPSTQATAKSVMRRRLIPYFSQMSLRDISTEVIQSFVSSSDTSPKTTKNCVAVLRMMWNSAKAWGYVTHNPFDGLVLPKQMKHEPRYFTLEEQKLIIDSAPEPYKTFYWLAAETGMRAGELCGIRWEDVSFGEAVVFVRQAVWRGNPGSPKTANGTRQFSISPGLQEHLRELYNRQRGWTGN
jgi:integrase